MASYSRRSRRYYGRKRASRRRWYRSKFSRRRRYRRYRQKRKYKKMLNKKEIKFVASMPYKWAIRPHLNIDYSSGVASLEYLRYCPSFALGIGSGNNVPEYNNWPFYSINVTPGYLSNQRIGQKINVVKYQIKGTFTITQAKSNYEGDEEDNKMPNYNAFSYSNPTCSGWIVRVIVMKCKAGDVQYPIFDQGYNQIMPSRAIVGNNVTIPQGNWLKRILPEWAMGNYLEDTGDYAFSDNDIINNSRLKTMPMQEGITNDVTVLKNKTYFVTPTKPIVNFRITTKKVGIMDWPRVSGKPDYVVPENVQTDTALATFFIFTPMAYIMDNIPFMTCVAKHKLSFVDP